MGKIFPYCVRHRLAILLVAMAALDVTAFMRHRIITLLIIAIALNAAACGWVLTESFRHGRHRIPWRDAAMVFGLLIVLNALVFSGAYMRLQRSKTPVITLEQPAPVFVWHGFDGATHRMDELKGRIVIVHFWASWCAPCRKEFPELAAFADRHPDAVVLTVSSDSEETKPEAFLRSIHEDVHMQHPANLLFAWEPDSDLGHDVFHTLSLPTTVVIDTHGIMRRKYSLPVNWADAATANYIDSLATR